MPEQTTPGPNVKLAWQTQIILFASLVMATAMYGLVLFVVVGQATQPPEPPGILLPIFGVVAISLLGISFVLRQKMLPPLANDEVDIRSLDGVEMTEARRTAVAKLSSANVVSWGLVEAVAALGLALAIMTHDINQFFPFLAGAVLGFALHRPQQETLRRALAAASV